MPSVIAIGSNSIRQLVVSKNGEKKNYRIENQLFLGLLENACFSDTAIAEAVEALVKLRENCDEDFRIIATSATRDAKNSALFLRKIYERLNRQVDIISGEAEAYYSYIGANIPYEQPMGLIDIGGGSTELAAARGDVVEDISDLELVSLQLGASRLFKLCPINSVSDIERAANIADESIKGLAISSSAPFILLGGTGTTLARIYKKQRNDKGDFNASISEIEELLEKIAGMNPAQREKIEGLPSTRLNIFPTGLLILFRLLKALKKDEVIISERSNMDGAVLKLFS